MHYRTFTRVINQIQGLQHQGATRVCQAALAAYLKFGLKLKIKKPINYKKELKAAAQYLINSIRPNEPLAQNGFKFILNRIAGQPTKFIFKKSAEEYLKLIDSHQNQIAKLGRLIIRTNDRVYTHCHSSTVEKLLMATYRQRHFKVFVSETRPLYQGRITIKNLSRKKIPTTSIVDSAAPFLISPASGRDLMMEEVILGADVILPDGSVINKIGSYGITLAAKVNRVPVYVVASLLKYSAMAKIKLETRPGKEVWPSAPANTQIINFAFDKIPADQITGIVCEFGLIKPAEVKKYIKKYYPWLKARTS